MRLSELIVDALPQEWWRIGNLYMLPGGNWHFCVGSHPRLDRSVRTVEWRGRQLAHGRRPFSGHDEGEPWGSDGVPPVLVLECEFGADWPTWVPAGPEGERTVEWPLDDVDIPSSLKERLREWQRVGEGLLLDDEDDPVDKQAWTQLVVNGRALASELAEELCIEVRLGIT